MMQLFLVLLCGLNLAGVSTENYTVSVIGWGDSNTQYGWDSGEAWIDYLGADIDNGGLFLNSGHPSWTAQELIDNYYKDVQEKSWKPTFVVLLMGLNDDGQGISVDTIYARIKSACSLVRADGMIAIVSTYPFQSVPGGIMYQVNDSLVANWPSFADGFVDPADDVYIGESAYHGDPVWFLNGYHWTALGRQRYAELYVAPAIRSLL